MVPALWPIHDTDATLRAESFRNNSSTVTTEIILITTKITKGMRSSRKARGHLDRYFVNLAFANQRAVLKSSEAKYL